MNRLLVLSELFLPTKGGTAVWAAEVYKRLGGPEIHIITADVSGAAEIDRSHPNTIHRISLRRVAWLRPESLVMYGRFFLKSLSLTLRHRFEAIHAFRALPEGLVAWGVARITRRPVVIYAHGEELTSWGRGNKYRAMCFALRHADRVIANSEHTQATLLSMGVPPTHIDIIYPGVDVGRFRPGLDSVDLSASLNIASDDKLIFSVGRLSRRKSFDQVIRAVAQLRTENLPVRYVIAGIGEDAKYLDALITEYKLHDVVHRVGAVSDEDLPRWMNACDVFAMPNRDLHGDSEGFGMVFIEAAACGKPSLAGVAGGTASAVIDGKTGIRVNGDDIQQVSAALNLLLRDDALRQALGAAALQRVSSDFTWERVAEKTRALSFQRRKL